VAVSCEHGNKSFGSIEYGEYFEPLSDCHLLDKLLIFPVASLWRLFDSVSNVNERSFT
jgi:hypothetical protein